MEKEIRALADAGKREEAIRKAEEYLQQNGEDESMLLLSGELLYAVGRMTDALNRFNAVVRLNPDNRKAKNYAAMIIGILDYFNTDLLNP